MMADRGKCIVLEHRKEKKKKKKKDKTTRDVILLICGFVSLAHLGIVLRITYEVQLIFFFY